MNNRKIIFVRILHQVLFSLHKMKEYSFIKSTFITSENDKVPSGEFDLIFFFNNFMNHSLFAKYIKKARAEKINVGYTLCTNIEKVLSDIYEGLKGSKVMKLK